MSEQQVLPELNITMDDRVATVTDEDGYEHTAYRAPGGVIQACRERQLLSALASLAQSEAERDRLQEVVKEYREKHGTCCYYDASGLCPTCTKAEALLAPHTEPKSKPVVTAEEQASNDERGVTTGA